VIAEVPVERRDNVAVHRRIADAVATAVAAATGA
jgi:hypothetical protein